MDIIDKLNKNNRQSLESIRLKNELKKHDKMFSGLKMNEIQRKLVKERKDSI